MKVERIRMASPRVGAVELRDRRHDHKAALTGGFVVGDGLPEVPSG